MHGILLFCATQCLFLSFTDILTSADQLQISPWSSLNEHLDDDKLSDIIRRLELLESSNDDLKSENRKLRDEVTGLKEYIPLLRAENQERFAELQAEINDLQTKNQQNEIKIEALRSTMQPDGTELASKLQSQINASEVENENLKDDVGSFNDGQHERQKSERPIDSLKNDHTKLSSKVTGLRNGLTQKRSAEKGHRIARAENEVNIAFYAAVGAHHIEHAGANQAIIFDDVITNLGNAYNKYAGDFRAPVAGTYVFSVTLMAYGDHTTHYRITQNGQGKGVIYLRGQDSTDATSAMTAILELKQGDNVTIQNIDPDEYLYGYGYSAFSGFLLQQDFSSSAVVGK